MKNTIIRAALIIAIALPCNASSALISSIDGLDIDGTKYDVTFHPGESFNSLFDPDRDGLYGEGDTAIINHAPTFFGNEPLALLAAQAIVHTLGDSDGTAVDVVNGKLTDGFAVPFERIDIRGDNWIRVGVDNLSLTQDQARTTATHLDSDPQLFRPYATFTRSSATVSEPTSIALTGLALVLMGVIGFRRRVS